MLPDVKIRVTATSARLLHAGHVVSALRRAPGPCGTLADLLAACVVASAPRARRVALLGFALGGIVGPLRALGCDAEVDAVDLSLAGAPLFRRFARTWAGPVRLHQAEAAAWLRRQRQGFDVIVDDLSAQVPGDVIKPEVSLSVLPGLIGRRLLPGGVRVANALPTPGYAWPALLACLAGGARQVHLVESRLFENRVLIAGERLPAARAHGRALRALLSALGSELAEGLRVTSPRALQRAPQPPARAPAPGRARPRAWRG